jgi:hypothetical protein
MIKLLEKMPFLSEIGYFINCFYVVVDDKTFASETCSALQMCIYTKLVKFIVRSRATDPIYFTRYYSIPKFIDAHKNVSEDTYLVTMDVSSLYTNIPYEEGVDLVADFYEETLSYSGNYDVEIMPVPKDTLKKLMFFILRNCTFEFNKGLYRQNFGTTMGASFSVKYANIFMYQWFRKYLQLYSGIKPIIIARLIDDCFFVWDNSEEELKLFETYLNNCHTSIKFEINFSKKQVSFLDTITYIEECKIKTSLYTKPTDKKQYLHFESNHPKHFFH